MDAWEVLGLEADADERAIKRAYARLLKVHRPDEDAEAFQRLREAYESALGEARWRAEYESEEDGDIAQPLLAEAAVVQEQAPPPALLPATEIPADYHLAAVPEPEISMTLIRQWLEEGRERQLIEVLPGLLSSEALLSFDRRQQFEEHLLELLEYNEHWSPALFERISQLLGWDDARGHLPCEPWRWHRLLDRCTAVAELEGLRRDLDGPRPERALSFVFNDLDDLHRRRLADSFTQSEWQHCLRVSDQVESQSQTLCERLGLDVQEGWRRWLPRSFGPLFVYIWLMYGTVMLLQDDLSRWRWTTIDVVLRLLFSLVGGALCIGVYSVLSRFATWLVAVDIPLSRVLLPAGLYRRGAGLLVLRHVLPVVVLAVGAASMLATQPWWERAVPFLLLAFSLYLTDATLRDRVPRPWSRVYLSLTRPTQEAGW
ncbi:MAG: J domain-containing protein [Pseudomonas putida]|nr:J domain-containing protein [Pseudomonas putida]